MIKYYQGESKVGIYNLAYSLALIMTLFNNALLQTVEPWLYKKINSKEVKDISKVAYTTLVLIAAVNILLIAVAPEAVKIFAPPEYADAIWIIPSVAMSVYFMYSYSLFASFEFYYEKNKYITIATLVGAVLNIILNFLFIPQFGYCAAGYTTLACYMVFAIMHYLFMKRICRDKMPGENIFELRILLGITVVFVGVGMMFLISYKSTILRYGLILLLFVMVCIFRKSIKSSLAKLVLVKKEK